MTAGADLWIPSRQSDLLDQNWSGIAAGEAVVWDSGTSKFVRGGVPVYETDQRLRQPGARQRDLLTSNFSDSGLFSGSGTFTAGVIYLFRLPVPSTMTFASMKLFQQAAGTTVTNAYVGWYDSSGNRLGVSADLASSFNTGATVEKTYTCASSTITGGPTVWVWAAILQGGGTPATLRVAANTNAAAVNFGAAASSAFVGSIGTGQTSLPATITPGSIALSALYTMVGAV